MQERWHHLRHLSQIALLSSLKMHLWQARDVHPLFSFLMEIFQCCMPSSLIKIYLYAMNINIFITNCMWYRLKTKQVINWQKSWTIISSNNINLVCEAYSSMTPSFSNGLSFEKGLGLLITPLCFFSCGNPISVVSAPLGLRFFFIFGGILTSLKASRTSSWST